MADDDVKLVLSLEARLTQFEKSWDRAQKLSNDKMKGIEGRAKQSAKRVDDSFANIGRGLASSMTRMAGAVGLGLGVLDFGRTAMAASKAFTDIQNSLKATGLEGKALESVFSGLFQIAQRNGTEMAPLVTLYSRMSLAQKELNATSGDMMRFTEAVSLALKVQGSSSQDASGALLQLSQAMGGGKVQAEEFNSLIDGAPTLLRAVAAGMVEAGGSVGTLTTLVKEGKVSSEAFFRAGIAGMPVLEQASAKMAGTVDQSMTRVSNAFTLLIGKLDETTGVSANASANLTDVARVIEALPGYLASASQGMAQFNKWLSEAASSTFWSNMRQFMAVKQYLFGQSNNGSGGSSGNTRIDDAFSASASAPKGSFSDYAKGMYGPQIDPRIKLNTTAVKPISIADYAVKATPKSGGGGGAVSDADRRADQVERYVEALERSGRVLQAEFDTLGKSNAERAKAIELARIGTVSDQGQLDRLTAVVGKNEEIRASIERVKKAQDAANDAAREFAGTLADGLADAVLEGKSLQNVMKDLVNDLARSAIKGLLTGEGALGGLFGMSGTGGKTGGLIGMLMGGLKFADGGHVSGPGTGTSDSIPARLSHGEFVVRASETAKHRQLLESINSGSLPGFANGGLVRPVPVPTFAGVAPALARGGEAGASQVVTISPTINVNASGGTPGQNRDLADQIGQQVQGSIRTLVSEELRQQMRPGGMLR